MAILCGPVTETISNITSKLICGHQVKISSIQPYYSTIEVQIDNQVIPGVGNVSVSLNDTIINITLLSKNVAAGTANISLSIETIEAPPPVSEATHYLDIYVKPYSWYGPSGAANQIVTKLGDINGTILNVFSSAGITDYQYIGTEVLTEADKPSFVTIRIKLKQMSAMGINSMAAPLMAYIAVIIASVLVIIFLVGVITGWKFTLAGAIEQLSGKEYSKEDVRGMVQGNVIPEQRANCKVQFANDPVGLARCEKAVQSGAADGLSDALGITGIDSTTLGIDTKIDACLAQYNIDGDINKYYSCLDNVAKFVEDETKKKVPKEPTDLTTMIFYGALGLGALYIITRSPALGPEREARERLRTGT